jgi:hypothetical protein
VSYCSLLDGVARTLVTTVQPTTTTLIPITVAAGGLLSLIGRNETAPIAIRAVGGFSDVVSGTIQIAASGLINPAPIVAAASPGMAPLVAARHRQRSVPTHRGLCQHSAACADGPPVCQRTGGLCEHPTMSAAN